MRGKTDSIGRTEISASVEEFDALTEKHEFSESYKEKKPE